MGYRELFKDSIEKPEAFWADAAKAVTWTREPRRVLDDSNPPFYRWYPDGELNTCANALDRHVADGRGDVPALIYDSPVTGTKRTYSYRRIARPHSAIRRSTAQPRSRQGRPRRHLHADDPRGGDRDAGLRTPRRGALGRIRRVRRPRVGGADRRRPPGGGRVGIVRDRAVANRRVQADAGRGDRDLRASAAQLRDPATRSAPLRTGSRAATSTGHELMAAAEPVDAVPVAATDPLYVLYTSGTTGKPKGIVRDNGGHAVALVWSMRNIYDIAPGDVFWAASDVGWVVGHSYIVVRAAARRARRPCSTRASRSSTPDPGAFWRVVSEHKVKALFTAPTAIRAIRKEDPDGAYLAKYDLSSLRYLFQAGERLDPDTYAWASQQLGIPVIDHWWQTETGWAIAANPVGLEPASDQGRLADACRCPATTCASCIRTATDATPVKRARSASGLPLPPGTLPTLWRDDDRYEASYLAEHPGYYLTGDGGYIDEDGYLFVMGRIDDVINVAGHRLSTGAIEAVLADAPGRCRVRGDRGRRRDQGPGAARARRAEGRCLGRRARGGIGCGGARGDRRRRVSATWSTSYRRCRRPARARSCARPCAASPTARTNRCRRPSRTRRARPLRPILRP